MSLRHRTALRPSRFPRVAAALTVAAGLIVVVQPVAASAQGFFQGMFGWGGAPQQPAPPAAPRAAPPPAGFGHRAPPYNPYQHQPRERTWSDNGGEPEQGGRWRTMCVRLCDGYYWPISQSVGRSRFYRDAMACRSSCGQEARLFYHAASSGDASAMVDQQGRPYSGLPNAFRYRKRLVEGCTCKPAPWSDAEVTRHRIYALNEAQERFRREQQQMIAEGGEVEAGEATVARSSVPAPQVIAGARVRPPEARIEPVAPADAPAPSARIDEAGAGDAPPATPGRAAQPTVAAAAGIPPPADHSASLSPAATAQPAARRRTRSASAGLPAAPVRASAPPPRAAPAGAARVAATSAPPAKRWPGD